MRSLRFLRKSKKGFTLVELVVVLAVIAVLASVITPSLAHTSENQSKDKYKQYCVSILESAESVCEAYNKGVRNVAGYTIVSTNGEVNYNGIQQCLSADNVYNYQCDITVFRQGSPSGLTETNNSLTTAYAQKDTVVVCLKKTTDGKMYAACCWYFEKKSKTAKYKFDYGKNSFIQANEAFYTPDK